MQCKAYPVHVSWQYIAIPRHVPISSQRTSITLFTIKGPSNPNSVVQFELNLKSAETGVYSLKIATTAFISRQAQSAEIVFFAVYFLYELNLGSLNPSNLSSQRVFTKKLKHSSNASFHFLCQNFYLLEEIRKDIFNQRS